MDIHLEELHRIDVKEIGFDFLSACTYQDTTTIVWYRKIPNGYEYRLRKYDVSNRMISSCKFCKQIRYDVIRMYQNICILIHLKGGFEKGHCIKNALFITGDGIFLKELTIGYGIRDISISPQGTLWCSYDKDGGFQSNTSLANKCNSQIIAAWNFFGENVCEMPFPCYDENFGFFHDSYSIYAKDNNEVYFFYDDQRHICQLQNMTKRKKIIFEKDVRPFHFISEENRFWIYFEPYIEDLKSLEVYELHEGKFIQKEQIDICSFDRKIKCYELYMNEHVLLIHHDHFIYRYDL